MVQWLGFYPSKVEVRVRFTVVALIILTQTSVIKLQCLQKSFGFSFYKISRFLVLFYENLKTTYILQRRSLVRKRGKAIIVIIQFNVLMSMFYPLNISSCPYYNYCIQITTLNIPVLYVDTFYAIPHSINS